MEIKEIAINMEEESLELIDVLFRHLCLNMPNGLIPDYFTFVHNLQLPHEIGMEVNNILYRFKIK